jgi:hypothetical protein
MTDRVAAGGRVSEEALVQGEKGATLLESQGEMGYLQLPRQVQGV